MLWELRGPSRGTGSCWTPVLVFVWPGSLGMVPHMGRAPLSFPARRDGSSIMGRQGIAREHTGDTMFRSVLTGQGMRTGRERLAKAPRLARKGFIRALAAGAAAGIAF